MIYNSNSRGLASKGSRLIITLFFGFAPLLQISASKPQYRHDEENNFRLPPINCVPCMKELSKAIEEGDEQKVINQIAVLYQIAYYGFPSVSSEISFLIELIDLMMKNYKFFSIETKYLIAKLILKISQESLCLTSYKSLSSDNKNNFENNYYVDKKIKAKVLKKLKNLKKLFNPKKEPSVEMINFLAQAKKFITILPTKKSEISKEIIFINELFTTCLCKGAKLSEEKIDFFTKKEFDFCKYGLTEQLAIVVTLMKSAKKKNKRQQIFDLLVDINSHTNYAEVKVEVIKALSSFLIEFYGRDKVKNNKKCQDRALKAFELILKEAKQDENTEAKCIAMQELIVLKKTLIKLYEKTNRVKEQYKNTAKAIDRYLIEIKNEHKNKMNNNFFSRIFFKTKRNEVDVIFESEDEIYRCATSHEMIEHYYIHNLAQ